MELVVTTVKISIYVYEVLPGDIWNGRTVTSVSPPPQRPETWNWMIYFSDNSITTQPGNAKWLVDRKVERIEI